MTVFQNVAKHVFHSSKYITSSTFINAIYFSLANIVDIARAETQDRVSNIEIKSFKY